MIARNRTRTVLTLVAVAMAIVGLTTTSASADVVLRVDFNSNQDSGGDSTTAGDPGLSAAAHNQAGWSSYHANHEVIAEFTTADYGGITVTPDWPNTTDNRVRQSIDRGTGNDNNWDDAAGDLNLVTDWIGIDTRTGNGGNGDWDGTTGTPTYMTLALGGLAAGNYDWTSFHHDTEHVYGPFAVWLSTDGGATFAQLDDGVMTDSTTGGTPDSGATEVGPDANSLSSTYHTSFRADGVNAVVFRFAPYSATAVHRQIWGMNGFELSGGAPRPLARSESPANGAMLEATSATLSWRAGDLAASHNVYFGDNLDDVNQATPEDDAFKGSQSEAVFAVQDLTPGATYYWRVDEVNDLDPNSPWKGDVWSFWVQPLIAWAPSPADGGQYVLSDPTLTWEPGMGALFHTVYFGESLEEVNDATTGGFMIVDATYDPGPLASDTTYYWRVDEFAPTGTQRGEVWGFTTVPEIAVTDPDLVGWWTFDEGVGNTAVDWSGNGNHGALVADPERVGGYHGDALAFDGRGDYVNCGTSPSLDIQDEITIACWIKVAAFTRTYETILAKGDNSYRMSRGPGDGDSVHFGCNGPTGDNLNATTIVTDDTWHHVTLVYDGVDKIVYIDGVEDARAASTGQINVSTYDLYIGANSQQGGRNLEGSVDDVRIYKRALTLEEIQVVMRGNPLLAGSPEPTPGAVVSIGDATALRWLPGDTAASHDVYFGTDKDAVVAADNSSPEFQGNQGGASFSLAGLVEFGGGDYYWRIDEVEADATVHAGNVWKFTVPDYLVVEDFESYDDDIEGGTAVFLTWIDGFENGTGSQAGYLTAVNGTFNETAIVHSGRQALPLVYDNAVAPGIAEVDRTLSPPQDWTREGVTTLVIHFRGDSANTGELYVKINGQKIPYNSDPADIASSQWVPWEIDLASAGVNAASVTSLTIGIEGGTTGTVYIDDIWLTKP